jgi:polyphosphate kinase
MDDSEVYRLPGILGLNEMFQISGIPRSDLKYPKHSTTTTVEFQPHEPNTPADLFAAIRESEVLVHHPYESFATSVQAFVEQAATDPHVLAIKQTLYRTSGDSPIVRSLISAAEAGKAVLALVEVKARFDEQNNIAWARQLEKAGVHVVYGLVGLKTHCKLTQVVRREKNGELAYYSHIGTGNYNPKTSRIYEDLGLFTHSSEVGAELTRLFNELSGYAIEKKFKRLLVAPRYLRNGLLKLIAKETDAALAGETSGIRFKVNSLVDEKVIDALYRASRAGVHVDISVRGICALIPGVPGLSDNIRVRSVLGRYLEHSRIYSFHNRGKPIVYIGSSDLMRRNLDRRIEVLVRLVSPEHIEEVNSIIDLHMSPIASSWSLESDGRWDRQVVADGALIDVQDTLMRDAVERNKAGRTQA